MTQHNPAYRRYLRRIIIITVVYLASVWLSSVILPKDAPANFLTVALALIPGLAALGWLWAIGRLLVELSDEYLRMLEVRKIVIATGVTLAITSVWGLLELYSSEIPKLPVFYVLPLWCGGLVAGKLANYLEMRGGEGSE